MKTDKIPRGQTEDRRAYMKKWNAENPRDRRAYKSAYDRANKERHAEKYKANREIIRKKRKAEYQQNREKHLQRAKRNLEVNREKVLDYQSRYYEQNAEKVKRRVSSYQKANRQKMNVLSSRRRVREANNGGSHTLEELRRKFMLLGDVCFYCGVGGDLTIDHDIPISRGGTDNIENILPACRSCNSSKNAKTAHEFLSKKATKASAIKR